MSKYKRLQKQEWHNKKHKLKLKEYHFNKNGHVKGFYTDENGIIYTHWLNNEEIEELKESGERDENLV